MSISLFNAVPAGAIAAMTDVEGAPHFKRADLGRYLDIVDVRHNFKNIEKKNYGMTIIAKNDESAEHPFISICGQHDYRTQKKWLVC